MERRAASLVLLLLLLTVAAVAVLAVEERAAQRQQVRAEQFQRLVGGLGFGPATDLSGCAFAFDPRLDGRCSREHGPIPGGGCFCPWHAGSLLCYPPLDGLSDSRLSGEEAGDAPPP